MSAQVFVTKDCLMKNVKDPSPQKIALNVLTLPHGRDTLTFSW